MTGGVFSVFALTCSGAFGSVIYSGVQDIAMVAVPGTVQSFQIHVAGTATSWDGLRFDISSQFGTSLNSPLAEVALAFSSFPFVARLDLGDPFPAAPLFPGGGTILWQITGPGSGSADGNFYVPMRVGGYSPLPVYLGWMHLDIKNSAFSTSTYPTVTVIDWAYSDIAGETIDMGYVPEPSTFSFLLLATLIGAALKLTARHSSARTHSGT